jgi:hypothetical protein
MSLARHVTAIEGLEREDYLDDNECSEPTWRRLSYDAFAPIENTAILAADPTPHIAAYKTSPAKRVGKKNHHYTTLAAKF